MKKIIFAFAPLILFGVFTLIPLDKASATVGGPTLIYDLKFDPATKSVYYTEQNYGGRGCPPELKAISTDTNQVRTIFSCDDPS